MEVKHYRPKEANIIKSYMHNVILESQHKKQTNKKIHHLLQK